MSFNAIRTFPVCAAMLIAVLALHMAPAQAQSFGFSVCPRGGSPTLNPQKMTIMHGDSKVYPDWFTRAIPATPSNAVTVTVESLGLDQVNSPYQKDGSPLTETGTATSARLLLGLVGDDGELIHGFYTGMGTARNGRNVPSQTSTFHSLEPGTRYAVTVFADDVEGETEATRLPVVAKRPIVRQCVETAPAAP